MKDRAMKYIPGPWVICEDPAPNPYWTAGLTIGAGPGDLRRICDVTMLGSIGGGISPMQAATAALIAASPDLLEAQTMGAQLNTPDFLDWIADRLVHVYGEKPNVDFVQSLRARSAAGRAAIAKASPP